MESGYFPKVAPLSPQSKELVDVYMWVETVIWSKKITKAKACWNVSFKK